jgi:membrane associated rhomboid family serine protease
MDAPIDHARKRLTTAVIPPMLAVIVLWAVFLADRLFELRLYRYGILPRHIDGLWGVLAAPFLHGGFDHLIANSGPILVLGWLLVYFFPKVAWRVVLACWLIGGSWVWLIARDNYHIGASGVIYGLAAFLFVSGVIRRRIALMGVSLIVVFLYGSWVWGVLPLEPEKSWESHLFGAVAGALTAWFYRQIQPVHVPPPIVLEEDEALDVGPLATDPEVDPIHHANGLDPRNTNTTGVPW